MNHESLKPCCSAKALDVAIFLLFIILEMVFLQGAALSGDGDGCDVSLELVEPSDPMEPSNDVLSDSSWVACGEGLAARGENVPWLQGPS